MLSHFMHGEIRKILYAEYRMTSRFTISEYSDIDFPSLARTRGYAIYEEKKTWSRVPTQNYPRGFSDFNVNLLFNHLDLGS